MSAYLDSQIIPHFDVALMARKAEEKSSRSFRVKTNATD
jgi:hypothetical protein